MPDKLSAATVAKWLVLVGGSIFAGAFVIGAPIIMLLKPELYQIVLKQFAAVVGVPSAALASLCLVMFLEHTAGPVEFEALGFKFKGASGPIVLWVFCFLSIVGAIKLVWVST